MEPLVIITSKAHLPRMRAHKVLMDHGYTNWKFVVDTLEQAAIAAQAVPPPHIVISSAPAGLGQDGIAWVRQWIEETLVPRESWYVSLDDNVGGWTWLPEPWYSMDHIDFDWRPFQKVDAPLTTVEEQTWRQLYETPCPFPQVVQCWAELINECERRGTLAGGFATETNYFFRGTKWQALGYVRAQNAVWKNVGLPFYYWPGAMLEDFVRTVDIVARHNQVLINRFVKPQKKFFEEGGIGTFEQRRPNLVACCDELLKKYPGLVRRNKDQDYSLTFVPRSPQGVEKWRNSFVGLGAKILREK